MYVYIKYIYMCVYPGSPFANYFWNVFFHKTGIDFSKGLFHQRFQGTILSMVDFTSRSSRV